MSEVEEKIQQAAATNAQVLDLSKALLATNEIPPSIFKLTSLTELNLSGNGLASIPPEIGLLHNLEVLNVSDNKLSHLPHELGDLRKLRHIIAHHNYLSNIPSELATLHSCLSTLDLAYNRFSSLTTEVTQLLTLQHLSLAHNELHSLSPLVSRLTRLRSLDLQGNFLAALPHSLGRLEHLERLYLFDNRLTELPDSLGLLIHITDFQVVKGNTSLETHYPDGAGRDDALLFKHLQESAKHWPKEALFPQETVITPPIDESGETSPGSSTSPKDKTERRLTMRRVNEWFRSLRSKSGPSTDNPMDPTSPSFEEEEELRHERRKSFASFGGRSPEISPPMGRRHSDTSPLEIVTPAQSAKS